MEGKSFIHELTLVESNAFQAINNIEIIYFLTNLKIFSCDLKLPIDFGEMPFLNSLVMKFHSKIKNLNKLQLLEGLFLRSFSDNDCSTISELTCLKKLKLQGAFGSLHGVENLRSLHSLQLLHSKKLRDITPITKLPHLNYLYVEKCSSLRDYSALSGNASIKDMFLSELNSLRFVSKMSNLKSLRFWDVIDGDLSPLFQSSSLKEVSFHPDRKHYNYNLKQVQSHFIQK